MIAAPLLGAVLHELGQVGIDKRQLLRVLRGLLGQAVRLLVQPLRQGAQRHVDELSCRVLHNFARHHSDFQCVNDGAAEAGHCAAHMPLTTSSAFSSLHLLMCPSLVRSTASHSAQYRMTVSLAALHLLLGLGRHAAHLV